MSDYTKINLKDVEDSAVRFGLTPAVNALATIMLGITLAAVIGTGVVLRRSRARVGPQDATVLPV